MKQCDVVLSKIINISDCEQWAISAASMVFKPHYFENDYVRFDLEKKMFKYLRQQVHWNIIIYIAGKKICKKMRV